MTASAMRWLPALGGLTLCTAPLLHWVTPESNICAFACYGYGPGSQGDRLVSDLDGWSLSPALSIALLLAGAALIVAAATGRLLRVVCASAVLSTLGLVGFAATDAGVDHAVGRNFFSTVRPSAWLALPILGALVPTVVVEAGRRGAH